MTKKQCRRWSVEEERTLQRYVDARPQNLHYCFLMVAEQIERTPQAVANHWYSKLSKSYLKGEKSHASLLQRFVTYIRSKL